MSLEMGLNRSELLSEERSDAPGGVLSDGPGAVLSDGPGAKGHPTPARRVLDTNIVLDLWVFDEPRAEALRVSVETGSTHWLATTAMREELARVLAYPQIVKRLVHRDMPASAVLAHFDRWAQLHPDAPKAEYVCKDPDDQKFIDLAVTHNAALHSKDAQVLCMKNRLARCGVVMNPAT